MIRDLFPASIAARLARGNANPAPHGALSDYASRLRRAYTLGLSFVAVLAIGAFVLLDDLIRTQADFATTINVAGRQRMLSQRVSKLAHSVVLLSQTARTGATENARLERERGLLDRAIEEMATAHGRLMAGDGERGLPGIRSDGERRLYKEGPHRVDARVEGFLRDARLVAEAPDGFPAVLAVRRMGEASNGPLLAALHEVVEFQETAARAQAARAELLHFCLLLATLALLAAEAFLIFRPLVAALRRTERSLDQRKAELVHRARHDQLTGLLNRHALREMIDEGTIRPPYAVIAIDLDNFKEVNDAHGHEAGDALLRTVGAALRDNLREGDAAVRIGGDEFVVLLSIEEACTDRTIGRVTTRLRDAVADAVRDAHERSGVSASLGAALCPRHGNGFDEVLLNADIALYRAKTTGRNRAVMFEPSLRESHESRRRSEALVRECLDANGFEPHFQPQVDLRTGAVVGVEALARGRCAGEVLSPAAFMDTAEGTGLIVPLGKQVIAKAIRAAAAWHRDGVQFGRLSVNASTAQLRDPSLPDFLRGELERNGLPAQCLSVEVLETVLLDESNETIVECCRAIRSLGVAIELDDFGTGYASIANVERLGVRRIKIDRSILSGGTERDLLRAIVTMAEGMDLDVLAEGVETEADEARLIKLGCFQAQGFHYARPMPAADTRAWFDARPCGEPDRREHDGKEHDASVPHGRGAAA